MATGKGSGGRAHPASSGLDSAAMRARRRAWLNGERPMRSEPRVGDDVGASVPWFLASGWPPEVPRWRWRRWRRFTTNEGAAAGGID